MGDAGRVSGYGVVTWNAGGLHKGTDGGKQRGDWLLRQWDEDLSLGVMAIQETNCKSDGDLCDSVHESSPQSSCGWGCLGWCDACFEARLGSD